jgi:hypothetical protein
MLKKDVQPLEQISKRMLELEALFEDFNLFEDRQTKSNFCLKMEHFDGPLHPDVNICRQFKFVKLGLSCIRTDNKKDCYAYLNEKIGNRSKTVPVKIVNIIEDESRKQFFLFKRFVHPEDFLPSVYPLKSSDIDIFKVTKLSNSLESTSIAAFAFKAVFVPLQGNKPDEAAVFPLLTESHE